MTVKRILKTLALIFLSILVIAIAFIYFNKDKIIERLINQFEAQYQCEIEYSNTSIRIDESFPNLKLSVNDLEVSPRMDTSDFLNMQSIGLALNPWEIIKSSDKIRIKSLSITAPQVSLKIDEDGNSNWDFLTSTNETSGKNSYDLTLNDISIEYGTIAFEDKTQEVTIRINSLNYNGRLAYGNELINQNSTVDFVLNSDGLPMDIKDFNIAAKGETTYDNRNAELLIKAANLNINKVEFDVTGQAKNLNTTMDYDIAVQSKNQEFGNLLTLIHTLNIDDISKLKADGRFSISGNAQGSFSSNEAYPKYDFNIDTEEGIFSLPNHPQQLSLDVNASVKNTNSNEAYTLIDINNFKLQRDYEKVIGNVKIINNKSFHQVDYDIDAKLDDLKNFNAFTEIQLLSGKVEFVSNGNFDMREEIENIDFNVDWTSENIHIIMDSTNITSSASEGRGDSRQITVDLGKTTYGTSDFKGDISIKKPLNLLLKDEPIYINGNLKSDILDLNSLMSSSSESESSNNNMIQNIESNYTGHFDKIQYKGLPVSNVDVSGNLKNGNIKINNCNGSIEESDFSLNGVLSNITGYLNEESPLKGTVDVRSKKLNVSQLESLYYHPEYFSEETSEDAAFANMDVQIISSSDIVIYNESKLTDNLASLRLNDNTLKIQDFNSKSFGGTFKMEGDIVLNNDGSKIDLKTDLQNVSIAQCLGALPVIKKLSYPLSFIDGRINTTLSLSSFLDSDFKFIFSEVNAFALLETLDGKISRFEPLEKFNQFLGIQKKKEIIINQSKNWVTIKDGWVKVEEFIFDIDDYNFKVKGAHSLDNVMDYSILVEVPASQIAKINLDGKVSSGIVEKLNQLKSSKKGHLGLLFSMKGDMKSPLIELNEIDLITAGKEAIKQTINDAKEEAIAKVDSIKTKVETEIRDTINDLVKKGEEQIEQIADSLVVKVQDEIKNKIDSTVSSKIDTLAGKILKENVPLDSIKDKIFKLKDIFKRKKSE